MRIIKHGRVGIQSDGKLVISGYVIRTDDADSDHGEEALVTQVLERLRRSAALAEVGLITDCVFLGSE